MPDRHEEGAAAPPRLFFMLLSLGFEWDAFARDEDDAGGLFGPEGFDGVDGGGAARGQVTREERRGYQGEGSGTIGNRIDRAYFEEQRGHQAHNDDSDHESAGYPDGGEGEPVADEHAGERLVLRAESHANADFASALGDGIGDDAVDADDAEQQRHATRYAKHDEREGSASHRALVEKVHGVNVSQGKIRVQGPDGLPDFVQETLRAGARAANDEGDFAHGHGIVALKVIHQEGPINDSGGRFADAFIVNVADDTDDFPPVVLRSDADTFAERRGGIMPKFASNVFRDHGDGNFLVGVVPGDFSAGHQRRADCVQVFGRNESKGAERRKFALGISAVFNEDGIVPASEGHGEHRDDSRGSDARNRREPVQDFFFGSDDLLILLHHGAGNRDAEGLQRSWSEESRIDVSEGPESADHQPGAD